MNLFEYSKEVFCVLTLRSFVALLRNAKKKILSHLTLSSVRLTIMTLIKKVWIGYETCLKEQGKKNYNLLLSTEDAFVHLTLVTFEMKKKSFWHIAFKPFYSIIFQYGYQWFCLHFNILNSKSLAKTKRIDGKNFLSKIKSYYNRLSFTFQCNTFEVVERKYIIKYLCLIRSRKVTLLKTSRGFIFLSNFLEIYFLSLKGSNLATEFILQNLSF